MSNDKLEEIQALLDKGDAYKVDSDDIQGLLDKVTEQRKEIQKLKEQLRWTQQQNTQRWQDYYYGR